MKLLDLHHGRPLTRGGLTLFPVWNGTAVVQRGYDLHSDHVRVDERAGAPVVSELIITNGGQRPALVLAGELLEGGQQHRVAARSVVIGQHDAVVLDVRCVEEGRWSGTRSHHRTGRRAPVSVRTAGNQGAVWGRIREYEQEYGVTGTHSVLDATQSVQERAAALVKDLRPLPFQSGVLIGIGGQPLLLEVFDSPRTLHTVWEQLLQSAALDAVGAAQVATPGRRARRFLERLDRVPVAPVEAGLGRDFCGHSDYARLDTLVWNGRPVHTVASNVRHELVSV
jgi:hypothetical protein